MTAYYNEIEPFAAQWLRNLIAQKLIAPGDVDERDVRDIEPDDLKNYTQCHFFAGIGGWSYALRLAGWPDDRPVWTGSCPCQSFSAAGRGLGFADERHLWPSWHHLIAQSRPTIVFGEQVASKVALAWFDLVRSDLEAAGYTVGVADLCAAGVGAPHIRQRLWFVADTAITGCKTWSGNGIRTDRKDGGLSASSVCSLGELGHAGSAGLAGWPRERADNGAQCEAAERAGHWSDCDWLPCTDGKARPVESGTFPLAHGVPGRVGRLRAYGNAIVPQVAAEFIKAYCDIAG